MPSPSSVGRKLFAPYFDTSNPQAMSRGLELWGGMNAAQQRHVVGHLLYFLLLELGRLNRTGDEILEAVNSSVEQLEATLSGGAPDEDEQPSNVVRLPPHINGAPSAEATDDEADEAGDDEAGDDDEADNDDGDEGGEGDADSDGD